ncbi:putative lipoprotein [Myxococcus hansupus]|uniref:Putative lipoprotein n=1 Tax=Pseudomyxococcus hansupus TaxID=1297742 RepID=A0A0H4XAU4_9BACT|nr:hypothetical protein [Myxococcus hansupus]AKQ70810.1 putative lipoprotein [Myxococcus hansupus]
MMLKFAVKQSLLATGVALLLAGCGATVEEASPDTAAMESSEDALLNLLPACEEPEELEHVVEHACLHAEYGPFEPVTAAALGAPVLVDVSQAHTAYQVTLPKRSQFNYAGRVSFLPDESGEFAFMLSRHRGLRIFEAATGIEVAQECRYNIATNVCSSLKTALIADLEADTEYHLEFRSVLPSNAAFTLIIEEAGHHH